MSCCGVVALVSSVSGVLVSAGPGADAEPAIVAGFERFARESAGAAARLDPVDAGRLLIGELGCTACHRTAAPGLEPKRAPDLSGVGARVDPVWLRRYLAHPAEAAPGTTMPHALATVPVAERAATVDALVAHLITRTAPVPLPKPNGLNPMPPSFWDRGDAQAGATLYHRVGCVACHAAREHRPTAVAATDPTALLDEEELAEAGVPLPEKPFASVPLGHVAAKYTRRSLTEFLIVPLHARPAGRMPGMKLRASEAADIAAYLVQDAAQVVADSVTSPGAVPASPDGALRARGRAAFVALRCVACHAGGLDPAASEAEEATVGTPPSLEQVDPLGVTSCLIAEDDAGAAIGAGPRYVLDPAQRAAIGAALTDMRRNAAAGTASEPRAAAREAGVGPIGRPSARRLPMLDMTLLRLNCVACHERDGRGGVGTDRRAFFETVDHVDLGDEGRLPPRLTGVGARLRQPWLAQAVTGSVSLRPFMRARMPEYPQDTVATLPPALARADRPAGDEAVATGGFPAAAAEATALVSAGAALLDAGCVQCHPLGDKTLPGTVGVNLAGVTKRVESEWFRRLLLDPMAVRPGTKMPAFFGATVNRTILDGDAEKQIAALWAYLDRPVLEPLPAKLVAAASDFELIPAGRPVVIRTFMERAGTHAIAVGFPAGVHLAFDADRCRLAEAWRGRFLDARGTWVLAKSAPPADPLGNDPVVIDDLPPWAVLRGQEAPAAWPATVETVRFLGYSLDRDGVPSFRYRVAAADGGAAEITERIVPAGTAPRDGLLRSISVKPAAGATTLPQGLWFRPFAGAGIEIDTSAEVGRTSVRAQGTSLTATLDTATATGAVVRPVTGRDTYRAWTVPLQIDGPTVEVQYRW